MLVNVRKRTLALGVIVQPGEQEVPDDLGTYLVEHKAATAVGTKPSPERATPRKAEERTPAARSAAGRAPRRKK